MDFGVLLDVIIFVGGLVGCAGTLFGVKYFFDENRMQTIVQRFGARTVRLIVAAIYGLLAVSAGLRLF